MGFWTASWSSSGRAPPDPGRPPVSPPRGVSATDVLAHVPYFRVLPPRSRAALARRLRSVGFAPRQRVFEEGAPCEGLWIVMDGRIKIFRTSPAGREQVLHVEGPGATL